MGGLSGKLHIWNRGTKKGMKSTLSTIRPHLCIWLKRIYMAESQGFEPWVGINLRWFSRPVHSAALSTLQDAK